MKKFLSAVLALLMVLTVLPAVSLADGTATITVASPEAAVHAGDSLTLNVDLAENPGFANGMLRIAYDNAALTLTGITTKKLLLAGAVTNTAYMDASSKTVNIAYAAAENETENGTLCQLTFTVNENAAAGDYTVSVDVVKLQSETKSDIAVSVVPAKVQVGSDEAAYANAKICLKNNAGEWVPVGEKLLINNYRANNTTLCPWKQEYKLAVVNNGEVVAEVSADQWTIENRSNVFMSAQHLSSDPDGVLNVNAHGKKVGASGTITATLPDGSMLSCGVEVTAYARKLYISSFSGLGSTRYTTSTTDQNRPVFAGVGETFQPVYVLKNENANLTAEETAANTIVLRSNNTDVATVANGRITVVGEGVATVEIVANGFVDGAETELILATLTVYSGAEHFLGFDLYNEAGEKLEKNHTFANGNKTWKVTVAEGETKVFEIKADPETATLYPSSSRGVTYTSSDTASMTVQTLSDTKFAVTGVAVTTDAKTVRSVGGFSRHDANGKTIGGSFGPAILVDVTPKIQLDAITLDKTESKLLVGETEKLNATLTPAGASAEIVWSSSDETVATVEDGLVKAVAAGKTEIRATADGKSAVCTMTVEEPPVVSEGLRVALSDGATIGVGETAAIDLFVKSANADDSYSAFDFELSYDADKLEYTGFTGGDSATLYFVNAADGKLAVRGVGPKKLVSDTNALITFSFTAKASGESDVTILSAKGGTQDEAIGENAKPFAIDEAKKTAVITVLQSYTVNFSGGTVNGGKSALSVKKGETAAFTVDEKTGYDVVKVMDGETELVAADGVYAIAGVTDNHTVTIQYAAKTFDVSFAGAGASDATGAAKATYGVAYSFKLNRDDRYTYTVTASVNGETVDVTETDGEYTIAGEKVTGKIVVTVAKELNVSNIYQVRVYENGVVKETDTVAKTAAAYTFTLKDTSAWKLLKITVGGAAVEATEDDGSWKIAPVSGDIELYYGGIYRVTLPEGANGETKATYGTEYTFTVEPGKTVDKVTVGGKDYTPELNEDGSYSIKGEDITGDIVVTLKDADYTIEISEYVKMDGKAVMLIVMKGLPEGMLPVYEGTEFFWSEKYAGYAMVDITSTTLEKAEVLKKLSFKKAEASKVDYTGDVNITGTVDVNDAQLVYDMYNARYSDFALVSREKFLRADVNGDKMVDVQDATYIVSNVRD